MTSEHTGPSLATNTHPVRAYRYVAGAAPSDRRPVIGLDVDGVIALDDDATVPASKHTVEVWGKWRREITVADGTSDVIAALAEHGEIVWASAWSYNAHEALRELLHLPDEPWPFIPAQFDGAATVAEYAGGRPWAWITEATDAPSGPGGTIIKLDPRRGLVDLDIDALLRGLNAT